MSSVCDKHSKSAIAVCTAHKVLLCTSCLIQNTHPETDCVRHELEDLADQKDLALVQSLNTLKAIRDTKSNALNTKQSILKEKEALLQRVKVFRDDMDSKIDGMFNKTTKIIENLARDLDKKYEHAADEIDNILSKYEKDVAEFDENTVHEMEQKSAAAKDCLKKFELDDKLMCDFTPNGKLIDAIRYTVLGTVVFVEQRHFVDTAMKSPSIEETNKESDGVTRRPKSFIYVEDESKLKLKASPKSKRRSLGATIEKKLAAHTDGKASVRRLLERFGIREKKSKDAGQIPEGAAGAEIKGEVFTEVSFNSEQDVQDRKNTTISISSDSLTGLCRFTSISLLASEICLLDDKSSSLIVCDTSGTVTEILKKNKMLKMIKVDKDTVAVLSRDQSSQYKVSEYIVAEDGIKTKCLFTAKEEMGEVFGFDFDHASEKYALASQNGIFVYTAECQLDKKHDHVNLLRLLKTKDAGQLNAVFSFHTEDVYIIDAEEKSWTCFSIKTNQVTWTMQNNNIHPHSFLLRKDSLFLAHGHSLVPVDVKSGVLTETATVESSVDILSAIIAEDSDVAIVTASSVDPKESKIITFLGL
ncbi:uncharacterized protein LOC128238118 [Mya arenaria]|nr:uncharacterized protein LOC128238118 [Mya arenaria]